MIRNSNGSFILVCDSCGEESEDFESFDEAVEFKKDKSNGWNCVKVGSDWEDYCPYCCD